MKVQLIYEIDDSKEDGGSQDDLNRILKVDRLFSAVWNFDQWLRNRTKYPAVKDSEDTLETLDLCREVLRSELHDQGINLENDFN